jgi:cytochrome c556
MIRIVKLTVLGIVIGAICSVAYAQFARPGDAITYRRSVMRLIGHHFSAMGAVIKGEKDFEPTDFSRNASIVETIANLPTDAFFAQGSDKGDTTMSPDVFKEQDKFEAAIALFRTEAKKLSEAAGSGDMDAIKAQFGATAQSCKGCHGAFRKK